MFQRYTDRRRASSKVRPPSPTKSPVPIIASGMRPVPPKYTATAIDTTANAPHVATSAEEGFEPISSF